MKYLFTLLIGFIVSLGAANLQAQSVDEYFHNSAESYIHAELMDALQSVNEALEKYPNDSYLNQLKKLIEEELEKQQNQDSSNQQDNQDQNNQNQENESNQEQQENEQNQDNQNEDNSENQEQDSGNNDEPSADQSQQREDLQPGEMSREDAQKILDALAQKEKDLLKEFKKPQSKTENKNEKDW